MKNVMKKFTFAAAAAAVISFSGCYTQMISDDRNYDDGYAYSDTTNDGGNVAINNHYYLDDNYRRSRFRVSFNYYYPTFHSSWISSYFYSYYDDPYWGFGSPYYNPWICYPSPWVYNPPYWYPPHWYNPYPYWGYHHYPYWYYNPGPLTYSPPINNDKRYRNDGPERINPRGEAPQERAPITVGSPGISAPQNTDIGRREPIDERVPRETAQSVERRGNETPWWERRAKENTDQRAERESVARPREERRSKDVAPAERQSQRQERPRYVVPKEQRQRDADAKPREERRSYNSEPQRSNTPSYTPPANNNGGNSREAGTSQSGGGRKRAD